MVFLFKCHTFGSVLKFTVCLGLSINAGDGDNAQLPETNDRANDAPEEEPQGLENLTFVPSLNSTISKWIIYNSSDLYKVLSHIKKSLIFFLFLLFCFFFSPCI